jgi:transcriptional regulator with XRE-family HTH domain
MKIQEIFAFWVKHYRHILDLSQEELANRANLHRTYIGAVERSERNITLVNADKIAHALSVKLSDLTKEINPEDSKNA